MLATGGLWEELNSSFAFLAVYHQTKCAEPQSEECENTQDDDTRCSLFGEARAREEYIHKDAGASGKRRPLHRVRVPRGRFTHSLVPRACRMVRKRKSLPRDSKGFEPIDTYLKEVEEDLKKSSSSGETGRGRVTVRV